MAPELFVLQDDRLNNPQSVDIYRRAIYCFHLHLQYLVGISCFHLHLQYLVDCPTRPHKKVDNKLSLQARKT